MTDPGANRESQQQAPTGSVTRWVRRRIIVFALLMLTVLALIASRAYRLQVRDSERLRHLAEQQHIKQIELAPKRGAISDRHGARLAVSVDVDSVYANPKMMVGRAHGAADALAPVLGLRPSELVRKLESPRFFVWLKRRVTPRLAAQVRRLELRGVFLAKESRRFYPNRELASSILGFAGIDGKGLEGLELSLDDWLRGNAVRLSGLRDAMGRPVLSEGAPSETTSGDDVLLTIDKFIQYETEQALAEVQSKTNRQRGWVASVVMDPHTGDILAMANAPAFDPNRYGDVKANHWRNRSVADAFEPGSTMKVFSVTAALEAGVARDDERIDCEKGRWRVGRHVIHDSKPHSKLSVAGVLKKSSNIGVSKLAFRLGKTRLYRFLKRLGFGEATGLAVPGERKGVLRGPRRWSDIGLSNIAFGHGMTTTVIQLARALSAIGNGGKLMQPRIVLGVRDADGKSRRSFPLQGERVISESLSRRMLGLLRGVTEEGGTGEPAALDRYTVAGKTGTAQKVDPQTGTYGSDRWLSSFMGLVPASSPKLAIVVVVNEPETKHYHGGDVAGPVFRRIASKVLRYLGVPPDRSAEAIAARRGAAKRAVGVTASPRPEAPPLPEGGSHRRRLMVPDFTGMSMAEVISAAHRAGLDVRLLGSGTAVAQTPGPGAVSEGTVCRVSLKPSG